MMILKMMYNKRVDPLQANPEGIFHSNCCLYRGGLPAVQLLPEQVGWVNQTVPLELTKKI